MVTTARQVHFLHEEEIVDALSQAIEKRLKGSNESRTFSVQPITSMMTAVAHTQSLASQRRLANASADSEAPAASAADGDDPTTHKQTAVERIARNEIDDKDEDDEEEDLFASQVPVLQAIEISLSQKTVSASKKYNPLHVRAAMCEGRAYE